MMQFLRRLLHTDAPISPEMKRRAEASEQEIKQQRGELRQIVQNINAGERLMLTWADANRMVRGGKHD